MKGTGGVRVSLCLLVSMTMAAEAMRDLGSVEPYMAAWCAKQFPEQLPDFNGYHMALLKDNHQPIEPYLGMWCLAQFPEQLTEASLDVKEEEEEYYDVEEYLEHWAARSMAVLNANEDDTSGTTQVDVEPYIGEWCAWQFPEELEDVRLTVFEDVTTDSVPMEPVLAMWCMAQFPQEIQASALMNGLDNAQTLENELIQWGLGVTASTLKESSKCAGSNNYSAEKDLAIVCLSVVLGLALSLLLFVVARGRRCTGSGKELGFDDTDATVRGDVSDRELEIY